MQHNLLRLPRGREGFDTPDTKGGRTMSGTCATCRFAEIAPKWRNGPHASKWEAATDIFECRRLPVFYLKLPTDWCGEYQPKEEGR